MSTPITLYRAAAIRDAVGTDLTAPTDLPRTGQPNSTLDATPQHLALDTFDRDAHLEDHPSPTLWAGLVVKEGRIVAVGPSDEMETRIGRYFKVVDLPGMLLLPTMVNAHAHLDLTSMGSRPYSGQFVPWLEMVMRDAPQEVERIQAAVKLGLDLSRVGGVGFVGDIARTIASVQARCGQADLPGIPGVSYLECFGIGPNQTEAMTRLRQQADQLAACLSQTNLDQPPPSGSELITRSLGIQPHAPYSAGLDLYQYASQLAGRHGYPLSTHLAETPEEIQFVRHASGPLAELLQRLGKWDASIQPSGLHPVDQLMPVMTRHPWLLAHCNYVEDRHINLLSRSGASVAYCPAASDYFNHPPHRYRDMLQAGVNVCLGTDAIICQPPGKPYPLGILQQMRHLYQRDGTDPATLLAMATVNGIQAMRLPEGLATFQPDAPAGFFAVRINPYDATDPLAQALTHDEPVSPIIWQ